MYDVVPKVPRLAGCDVQAIACWVCQQCCRGFDCKQLQAMAMNRVYASLTRSDWLSLAVVVDADSKVGFAHCGCSASSSNNAAACDGGIHAFEILNSQSSSAVDLCICTRVPASFRLAHHW